MTSAGPPPWAATALPITQVFEIWYSRMKAGTDAGSEGGEEEEAGAASEETEG